MKEGQNKKFSLANKDHLQVFCDILFIIGAICPKCGYGTRRTSKRWARCKKCGERVERHDLKNIHVHKEKNDA